MALGTAIIAIVNFLTFPTWHLVILYAILLLIVGWRMLKTFGF